MATMEIKIDEVKCCGAGLCVLKAPELFDQREDDGIVVLLQPNPGPELHEKAKMAANLCPALAITISQ